MSEHAPTQCEFKGCERAARWVSTKLTGTGGTLRTCDEHRPDALPRSAGAGGRVWYEFRPMRASEQASVTQTERSA